MSELSEIKNLILSFDTQGLQAVFAAMTQNVVNPFGAQFFPCGMNQGELTGVFCCTGYTIPYAFTFYRANQVQFVDCNNNNQYLVSADFSGCWMAILTLANGNTYMFHIYINESQNKDARRAWQLYERNNPNANIRIFKPNFALRNEVGAGRRTRIFGVISPNGRCYTVAYNCERTFFNYKIEKAVFFANSTDLMVHHDLDFED